MAQDAEKLAAQAERLTELKKLGRPTFKEIGEAIGITERQVQRWFAGDGDVGRESLKKLADFLGTTPDYIEYGVTRRERADTPDLSLAGEPLATITARLDSIEAKLDALLAGEGAAESQQAVQEVARLLAAREWS
jgi:transcriptional regulator with XRE-family HTH domain